MKFNITQIKNDDLGNLSIKSETEYYNKAGEKLGKIEIQAHCCRIDGGLVILNKKGE